MTVGTAAPLIAAEALGKSFGTAPVLLEVNAGEVVCVIGPSGSGKTTLLRCLALLETPSEGRVTMSGTTIAAPKASAELRKSVRSVRSDIGMVFQHFNLWPHLTVLQNLIEAPIKVRKAPKEQAITEAKALLEKVGLSDKIDAYPSRLSGGQQQRVAIARALAMRPKVMLFDEVTSALDPEVIGEVTEVIRKLVAEYNLTMLMVTHQMGFARDISDRVCFFYGGRIEEQGPPQDLFGNPQRERTQ